MFCSLVACGQGYRAEEVMPEESLDQELGDEGAIDEGMIDSPDLGGNTGGGFAKGTSPATDSQFTTLPDGRKLSSIKVSGSSLSLAKGSGGSFTSSKLSEYKKLKEETLKDPAHKVQWVFMDMDDHRVIERSLSAGKRIFGASSSKIYVASALMDYQKGSISSSQLQLMADMLVVSSNTAWTNLQKQVGGGDADKGRERIHAFTQKMGYPTTRAFQGYWGNLHGNELVPDEAIETLYDIYTNQFPGAEWVWKLMHTCRTGASRGRKYIPSNIYVGGKTGTYDGATENPETGKQYNVKIRNHILTFNVDGRQYGLIVFANSGSDESAALLAGGLIREYTSAK